MDISASLIAKGTLGTAAAAGAGYMGYNYRNEIAGVFYKTNVVDSLNEKIKGLGIADECKLENLESPKECTLDKAKLEKINFSNKESADVSSDLASGKNIKLKIEKTEDSTDFPEGIKFTFSEFEADITIKKSNNQDENKIILKKGTNPEFKIEGGKLKKAWEFGNWGNKLGLTCTNSNNEKTCTVGDGGINVKEGENTVEGATLDGTGTKIKFAEEEAEHNQGFKFTVDSDVTLKKGGADATGVTKLFGSSSGSYEIKKEGGK